MCDFILAEQAEILDRYLSRWRSSSSTDWPPLRTVFTKRCAARLKVRRAVGDVAKFGGGTARLRPPLTEEELLNLEQSHNCVLPDSLREMYLSFDGEHTEWGPMGDLSGWGGGLANGLRLLPLVEALSHDSQSLSELPLPSPERWYVTPPDWPRMTPEGASGRFGCRTAPAPTAPRGRRKYCQSCLIFGVLHPSKSGLINKYTVKHSAPFHFLPLLFLICTCPRRREAHSVGHLEAAFAGDKDEVMSDAIPLTSTAGFGTAGKNAMHLVLSF